MGRAIIKNLKDLEKEIDNLIVLVHTEENISYLSDRFEKLIYCLNFINELTEEEKALIVEKINVLNESLKNKMDEKIEIIQNKQKELEILNTAKKSLLGI